jgi:hypothetical protein
MPNPFGIMILICLNEFTLPRPRQRIFAGYAGAWAYAGDAGRAAFKVSGGLSEGRLGPTRND